MSSSLQRLTRYGEMAPRREKAIDFGFEVAICLLEKGQIVKQANSEYGYKLVRNEAYGDAEFRVAVVNKTGKILTYTSLNIDQLLAKDWQLMDVPSEKNR